MTRRMSGLLDCLRWTSAVAVVVDHTANTMLVRYSEAPHAYKTPLLFLWTFLAGFGHEAVTVFFILSGFLVGGPLIAQVREKGYVSWTKYFADRLTRIYLVLAPALVFCFLIDRITLRLNPAMAETIASHSTAGVFAANLLNLQNFFALTFGTNGPIGTLAMEMWYYVAFPLLLAPFCFSLTRGRRLALVTTGVALVAVLGMAQPSFVLGFVIWTMGALTRVWHKAAVPWAALGMVQFPLCVLAVRLGLRKEMSEQAGWLFASDVLVAVSAYVLLSTFAQLPEKEGSPLNWKLHTWIAAFSYSLYAIHRPLLFAISAATKKWLGFGIEDVVVHPYQWAIVTLTPVACMVVAYGFAQLTEHNTRAVRMWVRKRTGVTPEIATVQV